MARKLRDYWDIVKLQGVRRLLGPSPRRLRLVQQDRFALLVPVNETVGRNLWILKKYEVGETAFLEQQVKPDDTCVDIGGNIGYFSLLLTRLASEGEVHVFEPIEENVRLIRASAALNGLDFPALNCSAVGDEIGEVQFSISEDSAYSSLIDTKRLPESNKRTVPITTLDSYCNAKGLQRIDVIKIDVEGAEADVVCGASQILSDPSRQPRIVMIELFEPNMRVFGTSPKQVFDALLGWGYTAYSLKDDTGALQPVTSGPNDSEYNYIFLQK
jgi:FkbM family methyltransferase